MRFAHGQNGQPSDTFDETLHNGAGRPCAFHQERAARERRLALPERGQRLQFLRIGRNVFARERLKLQAAARGQLGSNVALAVVVASP